jgi:uroporphyrinogen-III decarboxylase
MKSYLLKETVEDALDRTFKEMQHYADADAILADNFNNHFRLGSKNRIVDHIRSGRISPWIIYNCQSGIEFLDNLNEEQVNLILPYIDPDIWQKKFITSKSDVNWLKSVLKESGL